MSKTEIVHVTKNYSLFTRPVGNRAVSLAGRRRKMLAESMKRHGFLPCFPIIAVKKNGKLVIQDGQHRLAIAQGLGIPVYYMVTNVELNIPDIHTMTMDWKIRNYAESYAERGNPDYRELLDFADTHGISVGTARAILGNCGGPGCGGGITSAFNKGQWKVTSRHNAERVVRMFYALIDLEPSLKDRSLIGALFAFTLVKGLDDMRIITNARRKPEMLKKYGSRDGYLEMLETVYNFGRSRHDPVRVAAENALKARSPIKKAPRRPALRVAAAC